MDHSVRTGECKTQAEWCKKIGFRPNSIPQVRSGKSSFQHQHILNLYKKFGITPMFIYGLSGGMKQGVKDMPVTELLSIALARLQTQPQTKMKK